MRILLSQFRHADDRLERETIDAGVDLVVQTARDGAWIPIPPEVRKTIDGIIHSPPNTDVDGSPADYPNVRALVRAGVGFDGVDIKVWGQHGTAVFNVPDYGTSEVADHAIGLMLALTRGIITYHDAIRADPQKAGPKVLLQLSVGYGRRSLELSALVALGLERPPGRVPSECRSPSTILTCHPVWRSQSEHVGAQPFTNS